jgi:hypothetical protein
MLSDLSRPDEDVARDAMFFFPMSKTKRAASESTSVTRLNEIKLDWRANPDPHVQTANN